MNCEEAFKRTSLSQNKFDLLDTKDRSSNNDQSNSRERDNLD